MCSLCGILGGRGHWTESAASPDVFRNRSEAHTARRERQARTLVVNSVLSHYGLSLNDWPAGNAYLLRSRTGRTELVRQLSELWAAAERLSAKQCDPLDEALLQRLRTHNPQAAKLGGLSS
ncbi:MAG: hypothetical protein ACR2RL_21025 [Gammaproteobacteria bacterium]